MKIEEKLKAKYLYSSKSNFFKSLYFIFQYLKFKLKPRIINANWGIDMIVNDIFKNKKQGVFICLGIVLPILNGFWQTKFKGQVVNNQNNPIVGATVVSLTNKNKGTITDVEGNFSIKLKEGSVQISSIGYETKKVILSSNNLIVLNQAIESLEEVIVSASRETQKRQEISASIGLLTENQIKVTQKRIRT